MRIVGLPETAFKSIGAREPESLAGIARRNAETEPDSIEADLVKLGADDEVLGKVAKLIAVMAHFRVFEVSSGIHPSPGDEDPPR